MFTKDEKARYDYEKQVEFVRVQRGLMKHERQLGREEGLAIGREEGLAMGREEARAKDREEVHLEIARNCKQLGVPVEVIATATGLAKDVIEGL